MLTVVTIVFASRAASADEAAGAADAAAAGAEDNRISLAKESLVVMMVVMALS